jgi:hypothetical protein
MLQSVDFRQNTYKTIGRDDIGIISGYHSKTLRRTPRKRIRDVHLDPVRGLSRGAPGIVRAYRGAFAQNLSLATGTIVAEP